jgi:hypothetical protein
LNPDSGLKPNFDPDPDPGHLKITKKCVGFMELIFYTVNFLLNHQSP